MGVWAEAVGKAQQRFGLFPPHAACCPRPMALSVGKAEESGGCGSTACSPCTQTSLVPRLLESVAWARLREGLQEGEARKERLLGVRAVAPACQPLSPLSLSLSLCP